MNNKQVVALRGFKKKKTHLDWVFYSKRQDIVLLSYWENRSLFWCLPFFLYIIVFYCCMLEFDTQSYQLPIYDHFLHCDMFKWSTQLSGIGLFIQFILYDVHNSSMNQWQMFCVNLSRQIKIKLHVPNASDEIII